MELSFKSRKSAVAVGRNLNLFDGLAYNRVYLRYILLDISLRNLEETTLGLLKKVVHVITFVISLSFDARRKSNQFTRKIFLGDNSGVEFNMGSGCHF